MPKHPTESLKTICGITVMTLPKLSSLDSCNERASKRNRIRRNYKEIHGLWNHVYDFSLQNRSDIINHEDSKAKASVGPTKERISFIHIQTPLNKTKAVFIDD